MLTQFTDTYVRHQGKMSWLDLVMFFAQNKDKFEQLIHRHLSNAGAIWQQAIS